MYTSPQLPQDEAKKMMKVILDTYGMQINVWNPTDGIPPSSLLPQLSTTNHS
jgi:hypothetical protein